jgi:hypothetical protein
MIKYLQMNTNLISFGDGSLHFRRAARRINKQGKQSSIFNETHVFNLRTMKKAFPNFFDEHGKFISDEKKGLGRWIWKIYLCQQFAYGKKAANYLYLDAGCYLNFQSDFSKTRFNDYICMLETQEILAFQLRDFQYNSGTSEVLYSSDDLIKRLNCSSKDIATNQIEATTIFFRSGKQSQLFFDEWMQIAKEMNYHFLRSNSKTIKLSSQIEMYRYDQSIFSLLYKKNNYLAIENETWFSPDWQTSGKDFPIWAMRNRTGIDPFRFRIQDIFEKLELRYKLWQKLRNRVLYKYFYK